VTGPETLHPPLDRIAPPKTPPRAPDSDKVAPLLIVGGSNLHRLAALDALAREIAERAAGRRLELRTCAFAHPAAIGAGVNVWALAGPDSREWIGTAAGIGVTVDSLTALLTPAAERAAA
jgi:hypothetical protein